MTPPADLRGRSLLAVFAHPDDEAITCGGLLAWCAHLGVEVSLLCLTHGEHGQSGENGGNGEREHGALRHASAGDDLARTRRRELECAARELGVKNTTLLEHEDGMLPWLDDARLQGDIAGEIRRRTPDTVITFDADGAYGHPDHVAVHERTTAVVATLGAAAPALYYVTMPPGAMRAVADHAARKLRAHEERDRGVREAAREVPTRTSDPAASRAILGVDDPDAFGAEAPTPTLVVHAGAFAAAKLAALACHATQFRGSALQAVTPEDAPRFLGFEHYRRAAVGAAGRNFLDSFAAPDPTATAARRSSGPDSPGGAGHRRTP